MAGLYAVRPGSRRGLILAPSIPGGFGIAAPGPARRGHPLRPGPGLPKRLPKPPKAPNPTTAGVLKAWCLLHCPTSSDGGSDVSCLTAPLPCQTSQNLYMPRMPMPRAACEAAAGGGFFLPAQGLP